MRPQRERWPGATLSEDMHQKSPSQVFNVNDADPLLPASCSGVVQTKSQFGCTV